MPRLDAERIALWRTLGIVASNVSRELDAAIRAESGVTLAQYEILAALARGGGELRVSDLCHELQEVPSSLSRRLDRMVGRGHVERIGDTAARDRRTVIVRLLAPGREVWREAGLIYRRYVQRRFACVLTESDVAAMVRALTKVVEIPPEVDEPARWP